MSPPLINQTSPDNMHILLVDDEDSFRGALKAVLSGERWEVTDVDSGEAAIDLLNKGRFDVILLDYKMPGMTGLNVLQWMYEQKRDTPVIMLTAAGNEVVAVESMKLGAYDYIRKEHVDIDHLPVIVRGVYERYLFRVERNRRVEVERKGEQARVSTETFSAASASVGHLLGHTLSLMSFQLQECEDEFKTHMPAEQAGRFSESVKEMKRQFGLLSAGIESLVNLSRVVYENVAKPTGVISTEDQIDEVIKHLQLMKERETKMEGPQSAETESNR